MKILQLISISYLAYVSYAAATPQIDEHINVEVEKLPEGLTWEQWHMEHEHQLKKFTPDLFFSLHDTKNRGFLDRDDILSLYGLNRNEVVGTGDGMGQHDESELVDKEIAEKAVKLIMDIMEVDEDGKIMKQEYLDFVKRGGSFPDLGVGVGHHAGFESEYEIHHWNKYHQESDPDVKVVHREDVEHELLHHEHEIEHEEDVQRDVSRATVITDDELESRIAPKKIPMKYRNGL